MEGAERAEVVMLSTTDVWEITDASGKRVLVRRFNGWPEGEEHWQVFPLDEKGNRLGEFSPEEARPYVRLVCERVMGVTDGG